MNHSKTQDYFDFLKFSLTPDAAPPASTAEMDWQGLFRFGKKQALLGVLFDGMKRLPQGACGDVALIMQWTAMASQLQRRNKQAFRACDTLCREYAGHGFRTMVLKGQGAALRYANPYGRTPGDIDLYVEGGDVKVLAFVDRHYGMPDRFNMNHVDAPPTDGVDVELHYRCATMRNPFDNRRLQRWLDAHTGAELEHEECVVVDGSAVTFRTPATAFNLVYELVHIYNHLMFEGIGMRQLVDYFLLLQRPDAREAAAVLGKDVRALGLEGVSAAVMWVLQRTLGLERERMLTPPDERLGRFLLGKIVTGGNFGKHDREVMALHQGGRAEQYLRRLGRAWKLAAFFPSEALWDVYYRFALHVWQRKTRRALEKLKAKAPATTH